MNQIDIGDKSYQIADDWTKLSQAQLLELVPVVFYAPESVTAKVQALKILLPLKAKVWKKITPEQCYDMLVVSEWLWKKPLVSSPVSSFVFQGVEYFLPEARFKNVVGIEYAFADIYFRKFAKPKPDLKALDQLIATVCRPLKKNLNIHDPEWNGDTREKYNGAIAERRAKEMSTLPVWTKVLVLQFVAANLRELDRSYHQIFEKASEGQGKAGSTPPWIACLMQLAENGVFGDWDKTCYTPIHTIMLYLLQKKENSTTDGNQ